ncbi:type II secretion system protein N [Parapedomonas caeni]
MRLAELLVVLALIVLLVRLVLTATAPVSLAPPLTSSAAVNRSLAVDTRILGAFDPFFQVGGAGALSMSALEIVVFGTRSDSVAGRGSAILSVNDGPQRSYMVGEELMTGVRLHAVSLDGITINRHGTLEQLLLDQSIPATTVAPVVTDASALTTGPSASATAGDTAPPLPLPPGAGGAIASKNATLPTESNR